MKTTTQAFRKNLFLFVCAGFVTFSFITLLQFIPLPWFFIALVAMHGGIALFIISKRMFKKSGFAVSRYYKTQYLMLIPYLLIMLYVFASKAELIPYFEDLKIMITLGYSVVCVALTMWNYRRMKLDLAKQYQLMLSDDRDKMAPATTV